MTYAVYSHSTSNLGDEIQSIAALQFIPQGAKCELIKRDFPWNPRPAHHTRFLIANGWFSHSGLCFTLPPTITPFFVSLHVSPEFRLSKSAIELLRKFGPVGCRDLHTLRRLRAENIESYFSGCLTMTLRRSFAHTGGGGILNNCAPPSVTLGRTTVSVSQMLPRIGIHADSRIHRTIEKIANNWRNRSVSDFNQLPSVDRWLLTRFNDEQEHEEDHDRFSRARGLLKTYSTADAIFTTKLHCAIPGIAMGTPVAFFNPTNTPDPRFEGLEAFISDNSGTDASKEPRTYDLTAWSDALSSLVARAIEMRANPLCFSKERHLLEDLKNAQRQWIDPKTWATL